MTLEEKRQLAALISEVRKEVFNGNDGRKEVPKFLELPLECQMVFAAIGLTTTPLVTQIANVTQFQQWTVENKEIYRSQKEEE